MITARGQITCLLFFVALVFFVGLASAQSGRFAFRQPAMGTTFHIVLYAPDSVLARHAAEEAFERIASLEKRMSDYLATSEVSRLSQEAGTGRSVRVSSDLWTVLWYAQELARATGGAFDVTVGPLTRLWRWARRRQQLPSEEELQKARAATGYQYLVLDSTTQTVRLTTAGMRLDLGGIAKGYAGDEALKVLRGHGLTSAMVDAGGDIVLGEPPPDVPGWSIQVEGEQRIFSRQAVATSGSRYRYVERAGVRYSHILDPETGAGLTDGRQVTVVAPTGMMADALASAFSVLSQEETRRFLAKESHAAVQIFTQ